MSCSQVFLKVALIDIVVHIFPDLSVTIDMRHQTLAMVTKAKLLINSFCNYVSRPQCNIYLHAMGTVLYLGQVAYQQVNECACLPVNGE